MRTGLIGMTLLAVTTVQPVYGQTIDDLMKLGTSSRTLRMGTEVAGELTASDTLWSDGTYAQAWNLALNAGRDVTVDLLSDDFDAFLLLIGPGMEAALSDDDGAGACDARVTMPAPEGGRYRVIVNTVAEGTMGRFRLRVTGVPGPLTEGTCASAETFTAEQVEWLRGLATGGRTLSLGSEVRGSLTSSDDASWDGSYAQAWAFDVTAAQPVFIDLISEEFDAFLMVLGPGMTQPLFNDDAAGGCNARVAVEEAVPGRYQVVVNTIIQDATGRFRLRATTEALPPVEGSCETGAGDWIEDLTSEGRQLAMGQEHSAELTVSDAPSPDGSLAQAWDLVIRDARRLTVDLLSDEFDAYLWVLAPNGEVLQDDDGAGACDARVVVESPPNGTYRIVVNTTLPDQSGKYRLRVTEEPGPVTAGSCEGGEPDRS